MDVVQELENEIKKLKIEIRKLYRAWDLYSMCITMQAIFTNKVTQVFQRHHLVKLDISAKTIDLLEQGLQDDYTQRPSIKQFVKALKIKPT